MNSVSIENLSYAQHKTGSQPILDVYYAQTQTRASGISIKRFLLSIATLCAIFGLAIDLMFRYLV